jgi:hypothetical protein
MKEHLDAKAPYLIAAKDAHHDEAEMVAMTEEAEEAVNPMEQSLLYDVVTTEVIWAKIQPIGEACCS